MPAVQSQAHAVHADEMAPVSRLHFADDNDMDLFDEIQEDAALALLRAERGPRRSAAVEDAWWN